MGGGRGAARAGGVPARLPAAPATRRVVGPVPLCLEVLLRGEEHARLGTGPASSLRLVVVVVRRLWAAWFSTLCSSRWRPTRSSARSPSGARSRSSPSSGSSEVRSEGRRQERWRRMGGASSPRWGPAPARTPQHSRLLQPRNERGKALTAMRVRRRVAHVVLSAQRVPGRASGPQARVRRRHRRAARRLASRVHSGGGGARNRRAVGGARRRRRPGHALAGHAFHVLSRLHLLRRLGGVGRRRAAPTRRGVARGVAGGEQQRARWRRRAACSGRGGGAGRARRRGRGAGPRPEPLAAVAAEQRGAAGGVPGAALVRAWHEGCTGARLRSRPFSLRENGGLFRLKRVVCAGGGGGDGRGLHDGGLLVRPRHGAQRGAGVGAGGEAAAVSAGARAGGRRGRCSDGVLRGRRGGCAAAAAVGGGRGG